MTNNEGIPKELEWLYYVNDLYGGDTQKAFEDEVLRIYGVYNKQTRLQYFYELPNESLSVLKHYMKLEI